MTAICDARLIYGRGRISPVFICGAVFRFGSWRLTHVSRIFPGDFRTWIMNNDWHAFQLYNLNDLCFLLQTCHEEMQATKRGADQLLVLKQLTKLVHIALELLRGPEVSCFTALSALNRIIDLCVLHKAYHPWEYEEEDTPHRLRGKGPFAGQANVMDNAPIHNQLESILRGSPKTVRGSPSRHRQSSWRMRAMTHQDSIRSLRSILSPDGQRETSFIDDMINCDGPTSSSSVCDSERTPLEVLMNTDPSIIIGILQEAITTHARLMGTRHKCTPSARLRHCTHHCLQVLSARVLTVMCHGNSVQHKVASETHIKTFVDSLDPNHDPVSIRFVFCLHRPVINCIQMFPLEIDLISRSFLAFYKDNILRLYFASLCYFCEVIWFMVGFRVLPGAVKILGPVLWLGLGLY